MAGKDERGLEVGLFRYALIREAADLSLSGRERGVLVRALAAREHVGPDGRLVIVGRSTLDDWIRAYRAGGFEALCPRPRQSAPLTAARVLCLAEALKRELPDRTVAQVRQIMLASGEQVPALRTLQRHFARVGLNVRADGRTPDKVYGRFEASARNELWTGDGLHGPKIGGRTAILLAFIDDYSRALVGYRWGTAEDVLRLEAALRSGLCARGVPDGILVDRGSAFVSHQLLRACAVLGVKLIHASPRAATTKGKIERFFERYAANSWSSSQSARSLTSPSSTACSPRGSSRSITARAHRDRAEADRAVHGGRTADAALAGAVARGVPVAGDQDGHEDRDGVAARQPAMRSTRRWSAAAAS